MVTEPPDSTPHVASFGQLSHPFRTWLDDIGAAQEQRCRQFKALFDGISATQEKRSRELKALLDGISATREQRSREFKALLDGISASQEQRSREFKALAYVIGTSRERSGRNSKEMQVDSQPRKPRPHPPRIAEFLLYCFLPKKDRAALIGDLVEEYQTELLPKFGPRQAKIWYWSQVARSIAPVLRNFLIKSAIGAAFVGTAQWLWQYLGR